jgi:7-cyano-7-deazaguanine synthase in queuosine biosynthesis
MKIEISQDAKKIGVLCSGGVDSTILLYLLYKQYINSDLQIITFTTKTFAPEEMECITNVFSWIEEKFKFNLQNYIIKQGWIRDMVSDILQVYRTDYVLTGCNKVIWDENEFTPTVHLPYDTPPVRGKPLNEKHLRPFIDMDKIEVTKLYLDNDILDLLYLTRSCGHTSGYTEPCGGCYFCVERKWAMNKLGIEDIYK